MKLVEELELPELTNEQLETLCSTAEDAVKKHVLSRVTMKNVERLNVSVEAEGSKPLSILIDVDLALSPTEKGIADKRLADEAAKKGLRAAENCLKSLK